MSQNAAQVFQYFLKSMAELRYNLAGGRGQGAGGRGQGPGVVDN